MVATNITINISEKCHSSIEQSRDETKSGHDHAYDHMNHLVVAYSVGEFEMN